jgi:uncharacterized membrane protein YraQ (UPF0718 family)
MDFLLLAHGGGFHGWIVDAETTFFSGVLRMAKTMLAAAPFLLAGVLAAGILRGMVGADRIRSLLGVGRWSGPIRGYLLGCLLPVCSLGALPVARELQRAGVPSGTILSFVLVAPVLNPISIVYGLSHIQPLILGYFIGGTLIVSLGIGWCWDYFVGRYRDRHTAGPFETAPRSAGRRLLVAGVTATRGVAGPEAIDYLLAVLTMGLLGAFLPYGVLQKGLTPDNPWSPLVMALVAIPAYVTPFDVMMHFQLIVRDGYSMGAAFALILLGAGSNVGVANWLRRDYGTKPMLWFVAVLFISTLVIGYSADRTIVQANASIADHTHAFDGFTRVHHIPDGSDGFKWVYDMVVRDIRAPEVAGIALIGVLGFIGVVVVLAGKYLAAEEIIKHDPLIAKGAAWNPAVPSWVIGTVTAAGGVTGFIAMGYVFYPPAKDIFGDISNIRVEVYDAIRENDADEMIRMGFMWEDLVRKIPTSVLIRKGATPADVQAGVDEMLYALDMLHDYAEDEAYLKAKAIDLYLEETHRACRRAAENAMGF